LLPPSVAVHATVVLPIANWLPAGGAQAGLGATVAVGVDLLASAVSSGLACCGQLSTSSSHSSVSLRHRRPTHGAQRDQPTQRGDRTLTLDADGYYTIALNADVDAHADDPSGHGAARLPGETAPHS
jgi:hypothetical protein